MGMIRKILENGKVQVLHPDKKVKRKVETASVIPPENATTQARHVGGGYYELPSGERVKGKKAAEDLLKG